MKRIFALGLIVVMLTGCTSNSSKEETISNIFKQDMLAVSKIADSKGKRLPDNILVEEIEDVFKGIFDLAIFESSSVEYGEIVQGAGSDGNGGKVFCCKLPAYVTFTGTKASVDKFVEYFKNIDIVVSFGEFEIEELSEGMYEVNTTINFLGKAVSDTVMSSGKTAYTIKNNKVEVKQEEINLRDFDISMIIRPSNSDSAAVSLGVVNDGDHRIFDSENAKKDINITFGKESNKYYCEYCINNEEIEKAYINPENNILFDILSCDIVENDDNIKADLHVFNNTSKKVSIAIFDDKDNRVNIVEKVGSIEVK